MTHKLFLLDAYALIYRSYYAFIKNPRINSKGLNTSAMFGFVNTLEEVLRKEDPSHIAVAFDPPGPTFRHEMYEPYKAQRESTPEDIRLSVPYIKKMLEAYRIPIIEVMGYEADDVIGTLAKRGEKEGFDVYMMTPDKDYGQLVSDHIFMYKPNHSGNGFSLIDDKVLMEKYKLSSPEQMIDYLGLMGDSSDNIPGCPGVGPKTAEKLLAQFGSIENLLNNTSLLKGSLKTKVEDNREQILVSKHLATIVTDVPIDVELQSLKRESKDADAIRSLFEELEFKTLINRVLGQDKKKESAPLQKDFFSLFDNAESDVEKEESAFVSKFETLKEIPHSYHLIESDKDIIALLEKLQSSTECAFDTETTGLEPTNCDLIGASFAFNEGEAYYVNLSEDYDQAKRQIGLLKPFFENESIKKIGQNIKFDIVVLDRYDIRVKGSIFDTMIAHYLINPEERHGMDYLAEKYLNYTTIHIEELIGAKGKGQRSMRSVDKTVVSEYACEDADITLKLKNRLEPEIRSKGLEDLFYKIEAPLVYVLAEMEIVGVRIDSDALHHLSAEFSAEMKIVEDDILEMAGVDFNVNSPKQIGEVLFEKMKIIDKPKKTKTGQYSTGEEELTKLKSKHPIIDKILEYRGLKKLLGTYIDSFPSLVNPRTGKIHTSFNQTITSTGRLSSSNPNLQNIPIRDERGKKIRKVFIPDEGAFFLSADYSQIELRVMAHLSGDVNMIEAFNSDKDIHAATAAKIYKVSLDEVTDEMRRRAKTANFGIIYGISVFGLSERLSISRAEAKELIDGYFESYPDVKKYMDEAIAEAKERGFVETLFGRQRFLPDINSQNSIVRGYAERNAINAPIQGTAADIIKKAMVNVSERIAKENLNSKMILQVHDELNFNVPFNEKEVMQRLVREEMESACQLSVPLKTDVGIGLNWLEAH